MPITLDNSSKEILIENMTISNPDVFNFLCDKDNREEWIERALIVGCAGLKQMILTDNVDYVEKKFNDFLQQARDVFKEQSEEVTQKIDDTFSLEKNTSPLYKLQSLILDYFDEDNGKFKVLVDGYFNKDGGEVRKLLDQSFDLKNTDSPFYQLIKNIEEATGKDENAIKELLDPHKTDSPAEKLKREIFLKFKELKEQEMQQLNERIKEMREQELKDIRDVVLKAEAVAEEKERGTAKGFDFEELVYNSLLEMSSSFEDEVEAVGRSAGRSAKKGDIVIDIDGDEKCRIVVECKDAGGYTAKKTMEEINEAIDNRNAAYGIFLFAKQEQMPSQFNCVKITDSYLITYMDNENLHFAYRLARTLLKHQQTHNDSVETAKISSEVQKIEELMKNINTMQSKVTQIINSGEYLKTELKKLYEGVDLSLNRIESYLGSEKAVVE
jgi:hypothetical protein